MSEKDAAMTQDTHNTAGALVPTPLSPAFVDHPIFKWLIPSIGVSSALVVIGFIVVSARTDLLGVDVVDRSVVVYVEAAGSMFKNLVVMALDGPRRFAALVGFLLLLRLCWNHGDAILRRTTFAGPLAPDKCRRVATLMLVLIVGVFAVKLLTFDMPIVAIQDWMFKPPNLPEEAKPSNLEPPVFDRLTELLPELVELRKTQLTEDRACMSLGKAWSSERIKCRVAAGDPSQMLHEFFWYCVLSFFPLVVVSGLERKPPPHDVTLVRLQRWCWAILLVNIFTVPYVYGKLLSGFDARQVDVVCKASGGAAASREAKSDDVSVEQSPASALSLCDGPTARASLLSSTDKILVLYLSDEGRIALMNTSDVSFIRFIDTKDVLQLMLTRQAEQQVRREAQ